VDDLTDPFQLGLTPVHPGFAANTNALPRGRHALGVSIRRIDEQPVGGGLALLLLQEEAIEASIAGISSGNDAAYAQGVTVKRPGTHPLAQLLYRDPSGAVPGVRQGGGGG